MKSKLLSSQLYASQKKLYIIIGFAKCVCVYNTPFCSQGLQGFGQLELFKKVHSHGWITQEFWNVIILEQQLGQGLLDNNILWPN